MTIAQKFANFDTLNPHVYEYFKTFTNELIRAGRSHGGAKAVVERIRWETSITTTGPVFKVSNDFTSRYSRKFMDEFPQHAGFFRCKPIRTP